MLISPFACAVKECDRPRMTRGFCKAHYTRLIRYGDVRADDPLRIVLPADTPCSVENCSARISSHKYRLCEKHYTRQLKYGDPLVTRGPERGQARAVRFWSKVDKNGPLGCWIWTASLDSSGYGQFIVVRGQRGYPLRAHRVAWEYLRGSIPNERVVDHRCRNRACVNPEHMELVTNRENIVRGVSPSAINGRKTHCKNGHPFDEENTYRPPRGGRQCRTCQRLRNRRSVRR